MKGAVELIVDTKSNSMFVFVNDHWANVNKLSPEDRQWLADHPPPIEEPFWDELRGEWI